MREPHAMPPRSDPYPAFLTTLTMVLPQQQVGLCWPVQAGGAALVTVSSHPQPASGGRPRLHETAWRSPLTSSYFAFSSATLEPGPRVQVNTGNKEVRAWRFTS